MDILSLKAIFILAFYRMYTGRMRLMATADEVLRLAQDLPSKDEKALGDWLRHRSVAFFKRRESGNRPASEASCRFKFPRILDRRSRDVPSIEVPSGECHFLLSDRKLPSEEIVPETAACRHLRLPSDPMPFKDLPLSWNRKLFRMMFQSGNAGSGISEARLQMPLAARDMSAAAGSLHSSRRFLFCLGMVSSLADHPCLIIEKPGFEESDETAFWLQVSRLTQKGTAVLVVSDDPSGMDNASFLSVIKDGCFLGSLAREELDASEDFLWVKCRVFDPSKARLWPRHHLKIVTLTGDLFLALQRDRHQSRLLASGLREDYGLALYPERTRPPTIKERLVKTLLDASLGHQGAA